MIFFPSVQRVFFALRGLGRRLCRMLVLSAGLALPALPAFAAPIFVLNSLSASYSVIDPVSWK